MMPRIHIAMISLLLVFPSWGAPGQAPFAEESKAKTDLREAIFRYMFDHYNNYGSDVRLLCIEPERPQPASFLLRFARHNPRVVWSSECAANPGRMNGIQSKKTGERGLLMKVLSITWIRGGEAEAHVEAFSDGIAANLNALSLTLKDGQWKVTRDKLEGVS